MSGQIRLLKRAPYSSYVDILDPYQQQQQMPDMNMRYGKRIMGMGQAEDLAEDRLLNYGEF